MRTHRRSLEIILQDPIFSHAGLAGLNDHPALEVIEELLAVLSSNGEQDIYDDVEAMRFVSVPKTVTETAIASPGLR